MHKFLFIWLFFAPPLLYGQIVNIENKRLSDKKEGFAGSFDVNVNYTFNTIELFQFGSRVQLAYHKKRHYTLVLGDHSLVTSGGASLVNNGFEHIRYNYTLKDSGKIIYEVYQQLQFNSVQRIKSRFLLGTGFRFMLIDKKNYQFNLGTGLMAEHEDLTDLGISQDLLSANYLSFDGQFNDHFGMNSITYFQPKLIDFGNYRMSNETSFRLKVNKFITFKIIYSISHDSRDLEGVRKTNYILKNALSLNF